MAEGEEKTIEEKQEEIATINGCLPRELITEILLRLSIRSLVRFKSVCKTWNNLISSQSFAKSHLHGIKNPASLLFVRKKDSIFSFYLYLKGVCDLVGSSVKIEGKLHTLRSVSIYILGSSNGLICIQDNTICVGCVFNPTTNERRSIPFPICFIFGCGFSFVPSIDDYKIVLLTRKSSNNRVYIFSLRGSQWRILDGSSTGFHALVDPSHDSPYLGETTQATLWNEAFYWVVPVHEGFSLLKFDVIKEKFSRVSNLKENCRHYTEMASICVTEHNSLCVCQLARPSSIEMWVLEAEYGDWKLKLQVDLQFPGASLIGSTSDGYVFMRSRNERKMQFMVVDTNQGRPTCYHFTGEGFIYVASFTASLVSPHYGS